MLMFIQVPMGLYLNIIFYGGSSQNERYILQMTLKGGNKHPQGSWKAVGYQNGVR